MIKKGWLQILFNRFLLFSLVSSIFLLSFIAGIILVMIKAAPVPERLLFIIIFFTGLFNAVNNMLLMFLRQKLQAGR